MTRVYWIRHAEAEGNLYRRCHGQYNSLITENGKSQIDALEARFKDIKIDAVYSSDLFRARRTAMALANPRRLEINTDERLREIALGPWEDTTWCELAYSMSELYGDFSHRPWDFNIQGGESMRQAAARTRAALMDIVGRHNGQTVAVFSHGMVTRSVMTLMSGFELERMNDLPHGDNTSVSLLEFSDGGVEVRFYADNSHLGELSTLARQSWWRNSTFHDVGFRFREVMFPADTEIVEAYRRDAWKTIYGSLQNYEEELFLQEAARQADAYPMAVALALFGNAPAGIIQLDTKACLKPQSGHISFFYLAPEYRGKGMGVQLLGHAVSLCRKLGRQSIVLRVSDKNEAGIKFYRRNGFKRFGTEESFSGQLYLMELDITVS